ncbi:hypothetical protein HID58_052529 [Brassica napus]|uniref:CP12 domain-containing protein n=1 Tax=Brassica napus TaxID=3708 RepID=A0ABQ8AC29_BRANA|nr:hypothetical protein HID58_052529 [Brassica napus]
MAGHRVAHATLKGPSVVKELIIGMALGLAAGGLWKMHHWNEQRKTRAFYDLLERAATGINVATPRLVIRPAARLYAPVRLNYPWKFGSMNRMVTSVKATSEGGMISDKVEKSIQEAKETCADDPVSGECVAAWDEVEELSAAASHARDKKKAGGSDPLEEYCSDNPETDECRTYDN